MTDKEKNIIQAVIRTLESLTLSGRENMSKVLGCIEALEDMLETRAKEEAKQSSHLSLPNTVSSGSQKLEAHNG